MSMTHILQKIIEPLLVNDSLTVAQLQHQLRTKFAMTVPQKQIFRIVEQSGDKLDVIHERGRSTVILIPDYRNLINKNK